MFIVKFINYNFFFPRDSLEKKKNEEKHSVEMLLNRLRLRIINFTKRYSSIPKIDKQE